MFIQVFINNIDFIMININHIISMMPVSGGGTSILTVNGATIYCIDDYNSLLAQVK